MDGQVLHYEELRGSAGRRAFFRAKRYDALELFPAPAPRVQIGVNSIWRLTDISLSGLAIASDSIDDAGATIGVTFPVSISQSGVLLFEGAATVRRIESVGAGSKLALHFRDDFIDIPALRRKDAQARMRASFAALMPASSDAVPAEYRVLCSDVLATLRSYRAFLEQRADAVQGAVDTDGAFELCVEQLMPQWRGLWTRGNALAEAAMAEAAQMAALKKTTELVLTPELCAGPIWQRGYAKPLGYPGDHRMSRDVADWRRSGRTAYAQLLNRLGLEVCEHLCTRTDGVVDAIAEIAKDKPAGEILRCLSIGSGAACEVDDILKRAPRTPLHITLADQDGEALTVAREAHIAAIRAHRAGAVLDCRSVSLATIPSLDETGQQDVVYAFSLCDHLDDARAREVAKTAFKLVKPNGLLVLGNVNRCAESALWPMECLMDWRMHYRDEAEMLGWSEGLMKQAAWTACDSTGRSRALFVRKAG